MDNSSTTHGLGIPGLKDPPNILFDNADIKYIDLGPPRTKGGMIHRLGLLPHASVVLSCGGIGYLTAEPQSYSNLLPVVLLNSNNLISLYIVNFF